MASVRLICCFPFDIISAIGVPRGNASLSLLLQLLVLRQRFRAMISAHVRIDYLPPRMLAGRLQVDIAVVSEHRLFHEAKGTPCNSSRVIA
jgi:hypothetical protein